MNVMHSIDSARRENRKLLARLIDPDHIPSTDALFDMGSRAEADGVDLFFFGGSLITEGMDYNPVDVLKSSTTLPIILFPSTPAQLNNSADAVLFLSLISGRNPEFLIGHQVTAAPLLKKSNLEVLPTGYLLVDCGRPTTAQYISNTFPIPYNKGDVAAATALAGEMLGLKLMFLDGGSGADRPPAPEMIAAVRKAVDTPIIAGGGIRDPKQAHALWQAGADVVVIGNGARENPDLIPSLKVREIRK